MERMRVQFHNRPMLYAALGAVMASVLASLVPSGISFAMCALLVPVTAFLFHRRNYGFMMTAFMLIVLLRILLIPTAFREDTAIMRFLTNLRSGLKDAADRLFMDESATAIGVLLGDTSGMTSVQHATYAASGLLHMFAVSGLHVSLLTDTLGMMVRTRNRLLSSILLSLFLLFFCAVTGFSSSVLRAAFMLIGLRISRMRDKQVDPPSVLFFAMAMTLLCEPFSLYRAGFQLSFAAAGGIVLFGESFQKPFRKAFPCSKIVSALTSSTAAVIGMLPIMAYHFGELAWISIPLSVPLLPVMPIILLCGFFAILLYGIFPHVSVLLSYPAYGAMKFLNAIASAANVPPLRFPKPHPVVILAYYISLLLCSKLYLRNAERPPWIGLGCLVATIALWFAIS